MSSDTLTVWLHGAPLGRLLRLRNGRMRFQFEPDAIGRYGVGAQVLSLSLPLTSKRIEGPILDAFIRGLLPEQQVRTMIEAENKVPYGDDFALLRAVGAECAGAVQFLEEGVTADTGFLRPLTTREVTEMVHSLPTLSAPDALPITASLGGVQAKVLLTKSGDRWAWPALGAMSTHIVKPEPNSEILVPHLIQGEDWASKLALASGLSAAHTELEDFGGRLAIVVERYDRAHGRRLHQEDFTQALGLGALEKYERSAARPSRLQRIAIDAGSVSLDPTGFKEQLLRAVVFNAIIGNSDAHSKNYSLLIDEAGNFALAPLYDLAPTMLMNRNLVTSGHAIAGQTDLRYITRRHLAQEASTWGMRVDRAEGLIADQAAAVIEASVSVAIAPELSNLPEHVMARATQLLEGKVMQHVFA